MSGRDQQQQPPRRRRERVVVLLMSLFPLLVAGGFFAPGLIHVASVIAFAQSTDDTQRAPVADRIGPYARRPLLIPRDFSAGFVPELLDLDQLFLDSQLRVDASAEVVARVSSFSRSHGEVIADDDLGQYTEDIAFEDVLMQEVQQTIPLTAVLDLGPTPLCGTLHAANCVRDDDLTGETLVISQPIPEPGSGALLGLGVLLLAWRRRC